MAGIEKGHTPRPGPAADQEESERHPSPLVPSPADEFANFHSQGSTSTGNQSTVGKVAGNLEDDAGPEENLSGVQGSDGTRGNLGGQANDGRQTAAVRAMQASAGLDPVVQEEIARQGNARDPDKAG